MCALAWTDEQDDFLNDTYGRITDTEIANKLGKSIEAIRRHATRKGLNRRMAIYSLNDVCYLFGVNYRTVTRWRKHRWTPARRSVIATGRYRIWTFFEDDLERFVRDMPWAYDPTLMAEGEYLTRIAHQVHRADPWLTTRDAAMLARVDADTVCGWCRNGLACQRRFYHKMRGGPHGGMYVIRRSDLLAWIGR